jgi:hypothetical protein
MNNRFKSEQEEKMDVSQEASDNAMHVASDSSSYLYRVLSSDPGCSIRLKRQRVTLLSYAEVSKDPEAFIRHTQISPAVFEAVYKQLMDKTVAHPGSLSQSWQDHIQRAHTDPRNALFLILLLINEKHQQEWQKLLGEKGKLAEISSVAEKTGAKIGDLYFLKKFFMDQVNALVVAMLVAEKTVFVAQQDDDKMIEEQDAGVRRVAPK